MFVLIRSTSLRDKKSPANDCRWHFAEISSPTNQNEQSAACAV
jgi:hypothetical protein